MSKEEISIKDLVETKVLWVRIFLLALLVVGLGAAVFLAQQSQDVRERAAEPIQAPSPSPVVKFTPPESDLTPPFLRLVTAKDTYGVDETVPVYVYLNTDAKDTTGADVVLSYDPKLLEFDSDKIELNDVFRSYEYSEEEKGKINLSLFITPEVGHLPVTTQEEIQVALIYFKALAENEDEVSIDVEFEPGENTATTLVPFTEERTREPDNILESVAGASFKISAE